MSTELPAGVSALRNAHLAEYNKVSDVVLQLRDHQNRLNNYAILVYGILLGAGAEIYSRSKDASNALGGISTSNALFALSVFALFTFLILAWQQIYVDRVMFVLAHHIMKDIDQEVRSILSVALGAQGSRADRVMRYEESFFHLYNGAGQPLATSLGDKVFGLSRYAVTLFGAFTAECYLIFQ